MKMRSQSAMVAAAAKSAATALAQTATATRVSTGDVILEIRGTRSWTNPDMKVDGVQLVFDPQLTLKFDSKSFVLPKGQVMDSG